MVLERDRQIEGGKENEVRDQVIHFIVSLKIQKMNTLSLKCGKYALDL